MTWRGERRKQLPPDWATRRKQRLELDGNRCTHRFDEIIVNGVIVTPRCEQRATDVHHALDPHDHRIEALRSLCAHHHALHTQAEAQAARGVGAKRLRPRARHPGLIDPGG